MRTRQEKDEVLNIQSLQNNKALGEDSISRELLKYAGEDFKYKIVNLNGIFGYVKKLKRYRKNGGLHYFTPFIRNGINALQKL